MTKMSVRKAVQVATVGFFAVASFAMAQDTTTPSAGSNGANPPAAAAPAPAPATGGWRRVGDPQTQSDSSTANTTDSQISQSAPSGQTAAPSTYPEAGYPQAQQSQPQNNYPQAQPQSSYPQEIPPQVQQQQPMNGPPMQQQYPMQQQGSGYAPVPAQVSVPAGTYLTVRINQLLSSDRNQVGDAFSATLVKPLVANGIVVAEPGQTIGGRVSQVQKSGRIEGLAKLGVELTDLTLVDGQQIPIKTMFISRTANSTVGRDAGAIAGTTALGAAAGAVADLGRGAAIGAGAGAAVGIIGVLVTRGQPSVIVPEQVLTFRLEQPLTISTERSPQAFRYIQPGEYTQMANGPAPGYGYGVPGPVYAAAPAPYYASPYYGYYGYPYYPYSGFSLFVGPGFYGRGYYGYGPRYYGGVGVRGGVVIRR